MVEKKVVVTLGKDGSVKVEASGFKGNSCTEATIFLDKIFPKNVKMKKKDSFWEEEVCENLVDGLPSGHCG